MYCEYMRNEQAIEQLQKWGRNPLFTWSTAQRKKDSALATTSTASSRLLILLFCVSPLHFLTGNYKKLKQGIKDKIVVSAVKGVIPENLQIVGDYLHNQWQVPYDQIGVIAGPSHAEEGRHGKTLLPHHRLSR